VRTLGVAPLRNSRAGGAVIEMSRARKELGLEKKRDAADDGLAKLGDDERALGQNQATQAVRGLPALEIKEVRVIATAPPAHATRVDPHRDLARGLIRLTA